MARRKNNNTQRAGSVEAVRHKDKRTNIPTRELCGFVEGDETHPKTILYPRDPSLDPQLVWKGKDEQDQKDLAVPAVPIYIQEKISPQALIENLLRKRPRPNRNSNCSRISTALSSTSSSISIITSRTGPTA